MPKIRQIKNILKSIPTIEGAGVHLKRAFGFYHVPQLDPFLLLDDFRSDNPDHYIKGFPWHPHRGIETITYMLDGFVEHGDSMANKGVISPGGVQWMTAGSGVIHQEMPKGNKKGLMGGFQLWANLPASHKMMDPRYRDVKKATIPEVALDNGTKIKIICGKVNNVEGPVKDIVIEPEYLDVALPPDAVFRHPIKSGHAVFAYVIEGDESESLIIFDDGDEVLIITKDNPMRFLLVSGKPIKEPIAWSGPIVMNTQQELKLAFEEYQNGTFIKNKKSK